MSRFIIPDAQIISVEPLTSRAGNAYWRINFSMQVKGRNGQSFPKTTNIACFDAQQVQAIQPGMVCDIKGGVGVNKDGYLQLNFTGVVAKAAPAVPQSHPASQAAPAAPPPSYGTVPAAPTAPAQGAPAPAGNNFDDDIPF